MFRISNDDGYVDFDYKNDLNDEEGDNYLPDFYQGGTIELRFIESIRPGGGANLMEAFLNHDAVKDAKLIFLDCSPLYDRARTEQEASQRLHDFYVRFGFISKSNRGHDRMFRIQALPGKCDIDWDMSNDFHPVLRSAIRNRKVEEGVNFGCQ